LEAGGEISYGSFNDVNVDGYVSGPLTDTVSARLAVGSQQGDGWQKSESRPGDTLGHRNFNDGRLLIDWKPSDKVRFELGLNGWVDRSDTQAGQFLAFSPALPSPPGYADLTPGLQAYAAAHTPAPNNARDADWVPNQSFRNNDNFYQVSLRADWDVTDTTTLTSITSYAGLRRNDPQSIGGSNLPDLDIRTKDAIDTFTQELRLAGRASSGALRWMIGGNFEKDTANEDQIGFDYDESNSGVGPFRYHDFVSQNDQDIQTSSVFGSLDYDLLHNLTIQGSARYTESDDSFHGCLRDAGDGALSNAFTFLAQDILGNPNAANPGPGNCVSINPATANFVPIVAEHQNQNNDSWRLGLNWKPQAGTLVYGNVTQGYKAGGFNSLPAVFTTQFDPVTQESLLAYEVGFKQDFRNLGLQISGAAFYYDYTNKQLLGDVNEPVFGALPGLVTIPKSTVSGAEFALLWRPVRGLTINTAGTYIDSDISQNFLTVDPYGNSINIKGESFPNTPHWQSISSVNYDFPLHDQISGFVGGGFQYLSSSYAALGAVPLFRLNSRSLLDLRAGVTNGSWRLEVWGKNVTNQFYAITVAHLNDTVERLNGMPATFGVTLSYAYK
jgi:outer membrane receptor protein involved in Fe transport